MVYDSPHYPRVCRSYKCKLLKDVIAENTPLPSALTVIEQAKEMIREVESFLPTSAETNFRQRLVTQIEEPNGLAKTDVEFRLKVEALLEVYEKVFGVDDLVEKPEEILQ